MKTIVIGDIHGLNLWKQAINQSFDKVVFVGDYFDSFDIDGGTQMNNFLDIIQFKKDNMDKVILLIGNHDYHYMVSGQRYSGFQSDYQYQITDLLYQNKNLLQMCYIQDKLLFTHAGVTKTWLWTHDIVVSINLEEDINDLFKYKPNSFVFTEGKNHSPYGNDITQSPIWVRIPSLRKDKVKDYTQIFGHTPQPKGIKFEPNIVCVDYLFGREYLIIEGNGMKVESIGVYKETNTGS